MSAVVFAPESSAKLLVSSWDKNVYLYDLTEGASNAKLANTYEHRAPVLDVCFGADDDEAYTAGMDWAVNRYDAISMRPIVATLKLHISFTKLLLPEST